MTLLLLWCLCSLEESQVLAAPRWEVLPNRQEGLLVLHIHVSPGACVAGVFRPCAFEQASRDTALLPWGATGSVLCQPQGTENWWCGGHVTVGVCDMGDTRYKKGFGAGAGLSFGGSPGHTSVSSLLCQSLEIFAAFYGTALACGERKTRSPHLQPAMASEVAVRSLFPFPDTWGLPEKGFWFMGPSDRSSGSLWEFPYWPHIHVLLD